MTLQEIYNLDLYKLPLHKSNSKTITLDPVQHTVMTGVGQTLDYIAFVDLDIDNSGKLHIAVRQGSGHNNDVNGIISYLSSTDNGESWSEPLTIIPTPPDGIVTNPSICVTQTGRIWVSYGWQHSSKRFIYFVLSDDGGVTWTEPTWSTELDAIDRFTSDYDDNQITSPTRAIKVSDYLLKACYGIGEGGTNREGVIYKSIDNGITWQRLTKLLFETTYNNGEEPSILLLPDNRILGFVRSDSLNNTAVAWSPNISLRWSSFTTVCPGVGKPAVCATPSGTIVNINRWSGQGGDSIFTFSTDGGKNWSSPAKLLDEQDIYMYGGVVWSPVAGKIIAVYCYEPEGSTPNSGPTLMKCCTFSET